MFIPSKENLKSIITPFAKRLSFDQIKIKKQHVYECLARSQGFATDAALRCSEPFLFDISAEAEIKLHNAIECFTHKNVLPLLHGKSYLHQLVEESPYITPCKSSKIFKDTRGFWWTKVSESSSLSALYN